MIPIRAARPLAPLDLGAQGVEALLPERTERREPRVDAVQRLGAQRVEAARAVDSHVHEPRVAQDLEML